MDDYEEHCRLAEKLGYPPPLTKAQRGAQYQPHPTDPKIAEKNERYRLRKKPVLTAQEQQRLAELEARTTRNKEHAPPVSCQIEEQRDEARREIDRLNRLLILERYSAYDYAHGCIQALDRFLGTHQQEDFVKLVHAIHPTFQVEEAMAVLNTSSKGDCSSSEVYSAGTSECMTEVSEG